MKILHVAESIRGGCGTYLNQIVPQQIEELGIDKIHVIVPDAHHSQTPDIPAHRVSFFKRPKRSLRSLFSLGREIHRQVQAFQPDIIHAHSTFAGAVVRLQFGWRKKRPAVVYCPHGWVFDVRNSGWKQRIMELAEKNMARLCDVVIAISEYEARQGLRIGIAADRMCVVLNGLRRVAPKPVVSTWPDHRLKILFVGRLDEQKGFDILVKAIEPLRQKVSLRVVGEAVLTDDSRAVSALNDVEFLGWKTESEIQGQLAVADVVVMPSRWEGFGLVAIEAMRAGKAVIASHVGGLPEVILDGETGFLVPSGDSQSLRKAILKVDTETLSRLGDNGRRRFEEKFTIEQTHSALMNLYARVLKSSSHGSSDTSGATTDVA